MSEPQSHPALPGSRAPRRAALFSLALVALCVGIAGAAHEPPRSDSGPQAKATEVALARPVAKASNARSAAQAPSSAPRVADASRASALFAPHSWHVEPPPAPLPPPPPPAAPTAPPFPYNYVGQYTPQGDATVYFLATADRVIDAHVGDKLDGVYTFMSADANELTFNYMPLNIRQSLPVGANP